MSRARRKRGRVRRTTFEWAADVAEFITEGLVDFLFSWGRK